MALCGILLKAPLSALHGVMDRPRHCIWCGSICKDSSYSELRIFPSRGGNPIKF